MSLIKRNRSRRRRNFDEDSKVLIVTLLFCLVFSVIGLQKTLATYQIIVLGLVQLLMVMAIGVIRALRHLEYRVPEDVSVIGLDGTALAEYYNPKLATIKQQYQTLATRSVEILFGQIELKRSQIHEIVPFELASGESIQKIR